MLAARQYLQFTLLLYPQVEVVSTRVRERLANVRKLREESCVFLNMLNVAHSHHHACDVRKHADE